jgi:antitoxin component YwqK of YwqJK toxin-antitoxin module
VDGEFNGEWIWKYPNDKKAFQGEFQNGVPIGKHKYFYVNGNTKMRGSFAGGELDGKWEYFREDGTLDLEIEYEAGQAVKINGQRIKLPEPKAEE